MSSALLSAVRPGQWPGFNMHAARRTTSLLHVYGAMPQSAWVVFAAYCVEMHLYQERYAASHPTSVPSSITRSSFCPLTESHRKLLPCFGYSVACDATVRKKCLTVIVCDTSVARDALSSPMCSTIGCVMCENFRSLPVPDIVRS